MTTLEMNDVVKSIRDLPALPVIVSELISSLEDEDTGANTLAHKLSKDQALSAKTLRLANSSFYGRSSKVSTMQQAIAILGFNSVRTLVTSAAIFSGFSTATHASFNFEGFWRHSIATALCAKILAHEVGASQDLAFIAGLMHDIGRLVLLTAAPQNFEEVIAYRNEKDTYLLEAEIRILGIEHAMVGRALAAHWKFPATIQNAIANHHTPNVHDADSLASVIHFADCIAHALDLSNDDQDLVFPVSDAVSQKFNLEQAALSKIYQQVEAQFEEASKILLST
jgi:putative nucleotidyltransferase with HDIG domain